MYINHRDLDFKLEKILINKNTPSNNIPLYSTTSKIKIIIKKFLETYNCQLNIHSSPEFFTVHIEGGKCCSSGKNSLLETAICIAVLQYIEYKRDILNDSSPTQI